MNLVDIAVHDFHAKIHELFDKRWFLVSAGNFEANDFNTMTISWGFLGIMWSRPVVVVAVRPTRHTYKFMEGNDTFSLCSFPEQFRNDLQILGTRSGRDGDKIALTKLHPEPARIIPAPVFREADLRLECRKIYYHDYNPEMFLDQTIHEKYPLKDYHRVYYGQILSITGEAGLFLAPEK
jgi:flavin reductase (DIM6/NTAB) family NADH-FMN oxidoreductase RutF